MSKYHLKKFKRPPLDKIVSIDFETYPDTHTPEILGMYWEGGKAVYDLEKHNVRDEFFAWLDECKGINAHNIMFELQVLYEWGYDIFKLEGRIDDSMVMVAVNDSEQLKGLKEVCTTVGMNLKSWEEASKGSREGYMDYCLEDAEACHKVLYRMMGITDQNETWTAYRLEVECIWWAVESHYWGVCVDVEMLDRLRDKYTAKVEELLKELTTIAGTVINFNSNDQLRHVLFNTLGAKPDTQFYTNGGKAKIPLPSTSMGALRYYSTSPDVPEQAKLFVNKLLDYRKYAKLRSSYTSDKFKSFIQADGKIRPNVFLTGARTGRVSYRDPALQTIPARGDGAEMRNVFCASPGYYFVRADLSQIEYRLLAHFSQDPFLLDAYNSGKDLHEATGEMFGVDRDGGKTLNFSVVYGQGARAISAKLKKPVEVVFKLLNNYFSRFSKVKAFKDSVINYAYSNKHIRTISGRIRGLAAYCKREDGSVERLAVNTLIQGSNADIIKLIIVKQRKLLKPVGVKCVLQIHDELIFEVPRKIPRAKAEKVIEKLMTKTYQLSIPIETAVQSGFNWSEAKDK